MKIFVCILSFFLAAPLEAAYRVYKLKVTTYDAYGRVRKKPRVLLTTVDHIQYEHLNGGYRWTKVELMDTWYCPGDTSRRKKCAKPKERKPASGRGPAAYDKPKRVPIRYTRQPVIP